MIKKQYLADLSLITVAFIWGTTFQIVHDALVDIGTFPFLAIRFLVAFILLLPLCRRPWKWHISALWSGSFLMAGYALQTFGLVWTTPGKAAFITGLSVVLIPLMLAVRDKKLPGWGSLAGGLLAAAGLGFLTLEGSLLPGRGDLLVLGCAFFFALQILAVEKALKHMNPQNLTVVQLMVVSLLSFLMWGGFGGEVHFTELALVALLITSVLATSAAFLIQGWAQKYTSPSHVALAFTMEPVFAALYSYLVGGEVFTPQKIVGCLLVLAGILLGIARG